MEPVPTGTAPQSEDVPVGSYALALRIEEVLDRLKWLHWELADHQEQPVQELLLACLLTIEGMSARALDPTV